MAGEVQPTAATTERDAAGCAPPASVSYAGLDDAALVEAAKQSPDAFGVLYERHVRSVFAFCYSKLQDGPLAEDLTSQTFLHALRALPRYQQRGTPLKSWLFRIAANLITDRHRAQRPEQPLETPPPGYDEGVAFEPADPKSEADLAAWEQAEDFSRLIAGLTPEQRAVVRLRFVEGLPMADIAAQVGRTEGAVKMLLMRALQNLRRRLDQEAAHAG
ncbi:MAG TPA: RNA polymerase sigma factor [Chloroflexota bacterium]|nr:RNA polymerase sigma factor [Chloroflexota bacterium]